jgi:prephenate dehydratase
VTFLGSYPRADRQETEVSLRYSDAAFVDARAWLQAILSGEPDAR